VSVVNQTCIAFLGQCHTTGYEGVSIAETFPEIVGRAIEAARSGAEVRVITEPFYHPADLSGAVRRVLRRRPDIVVVEVIGWVAVSGRQAVDLSRLPRGLRSPYDRLRHFRIAAWRLRERWPITMGLISGVETHLTALATGPLRSLLPRLPRPTMLDYETALDEAARVLRAADGVEVVFQGPGVFNDSIDASSVAPNAEAVYRNVNAMTRRIANRHGALFVDRLGGAPLPKAKFFLPGSMRPSRIGQEAWGHMLAQHLRSEGLV
jgi:hypothetical protein